MAGKWSLHRIFSGVSAVKPHMPETATMNKAAVRRFFKKYKSVYIKPIRRHMGIGILKAWRTKGGFSFVKVKGKARTAADIDQLYRKLGVDSSSFIIQRDVNLIKYGGRPFDIRVMMMRNGNGQWTYTGMLAKVAGKGSVITNVARGGGYAVPVSTALSANFSPGQSESIKREMIALSRTICRYSGKYKYTSEIGIDFGIDRTGKIWVIEVNYDFPSHGLFNRLKDKSFYRLIKKTKKAYLARKRKRVS